MAASAKQIAQEIEALSATLVSEINESSKAAHGRARKASNDLGKLLVGFRKVSVTEDK